MMPDALVFSFNRLDFPSKCAVSSFNILHRPSYNLKCLSLSTDLNTLPKNLGSISKNGAHVNKPENVNIHNNHKRRVTV